MIKAYVYFTDSKLNIGSCKDGTDIYELIFSEQMAESGDHAYIKLEVLPRIGELISLHGEYPLELEVLEIRHTVSIGYGEEHTCEILFKTLHLTNWSKPL